MDFFGMFRKVVKGADSFQLKTVICDIWKKGTNGKSYMYDLAICRDNYAYQTIFNGTTVDSRCLKT
jgi:hypothetical protein